MRMEMCIRDSGRTVRPMDMEFTLILMEADMKVNGSKINNMVLVSSNGQMVLSTKAVTIRARNTTEVFSTGPMAPTTRANLTTTIYREWARIPGQMAVSTPANG